MEFSSKIEILSPSTLDSINPSFAKSARTSRTGVREKPVFTATSSSFTLSPGFRVKFSSEVIKKS